MRTCAITGTHAHVVSVNRRGLMRSGMAAHLFNTLANSVVKSSASDYARSAACEWPFTVAWPETRSRTLDKRARHCSLVAKLCQPYDGEELVWHKVDPAMGSVKVQGPQCSRPLSRPSAAAFFKPHKPKATPKAANAAAGSEDGTHGEGNSPAGIDGAPKAHAVCSVVSGFLASQQMALELPFVAVETQSACTVAFSRVPTFCMSAHRYDELRLNKLFSAESGRGIFTGLPVNTDENATVVKKEEEHDVAVKVEDAAVQADAAPTAPEKGTDGDSNLNGRPAMLSPGDKRRADDVGGEAADFPASKKPKESPAKPLPAKQSALEKAATSKGQRTMSSFFSKKPG